MSNERSFEVDPEWFKTFFHGIALDLWRQAITREQTRTQAGFLFRTLELDPPAKVLDVPCGNGRLAVELSARGFQLTGVDIAGEFIEEAHACSIARDLSIEWVHGDMRDLPGPGIFDGAFCWGNSFGYLDNDGNMDFLRSVGRALRPGGRFIIDALAGEMLFASFQAKRSFEIGDITMNVRNHYDPVRGRLDTEYSFVRDGITDTRTGTQRVYTAREVCCQLRKAGLTVVALYGGIEQEPFTIGSNQLIIVSQKPA